MGQTLKLDRFNLHDEYTGRIHGPGLARVHGSVQYIVKVKDGVKTVLEYEKLKKAAKKMVYKEIIATCQRGARERTQGDAVSPWCAGRDHGTARCVVGAAPAWGDARWATLWWTTRSFGLPVRMYLSSCWYVG